MPDITGKTAHEKYLINFSFEKGRHDAHEKFKTAITEMLMKYICTISFVRLSFVYLIQFHFLLKLH